MSLAVQFQTMAAMIIMGIILGMNMDVYERITLQMFRRIWVRAGGDIMFWVVQALLVFYVLLRVNEGELRLYIFAGLAAGFLMYRHFGRTTFINVLERLFTAERWLRRLLTAVLRVLVLYPVKFVLKLAGSSVMMGLTIITNFLSLFLRILLFPLKGVVRVAAPVVKRMIPLPILTLAEKIVHVTARMFRK